MREYFVPLFNFLHFISSTSYSSQYVVSQHRLRPVICAFLSCQKGHETVISIPSWFWQKHIFHYWLFTLLWFFWIPLALVLMYVPSSYRGDKRGLEMACYFNTPSIPYTFSKRLSVTLITLKLTRYNINNAGLLWYKKLQFKNFYVQNTEYLSLLQEGNFVIICFSLVPRNYTQRVFTE